MDFVKFPTQTTTIFPLANSKIGGQLLTERNQLSRETVANHSNIPYICGPSYTHSLDDFKLGKQGSNVLTISGGAAIVHGHFVHLDNSSASAITINLTEANATLSSQGKAVLSGTLCVGLRAMYANPNTVAASLQEEGADGFYKGIQVVILPESEFRLPENNGSGRYTPENQVTAHLKLGKFVFNNNTISGIVQNDTKHQCLDADKIYNIDALLESSYAKKSGLDPDKLYNMSGENGGQWINAVPSSIIWDANPKKRSTNDIVDPIWLKDYNVTGAQILEEAAVRYDSRDDTLKMVLPHTQVRGMKTSGVDQYYEPKTISIPAANRATGAGGVLNTRWINFLNGLDDKIATMYRMPGGKMRRFIDVLTSKEQLPSPPIGYYNEQTREAAYYDNRLQYSFNLLQTQVAQLNTKFNDFLSKLESDWKSAVTTDVTANLEESNVLTQSNLESLRKDLANFQGDVAGIQSSISESSASLSSHLEVYEALANRVTVLENRWTSTTSAVTDAPADSTDPDIEALKKDMKDLQQRIDKVQSTTSTITNNVQNLVNNTSSALDTLYKSLYGANKDGSSGDIQDAITSINQLRSQYDYLYDAIHDLYNGISAEVEKSTSNLYSKLLAALRSDIDAQIAAIAEQYNVSADWAPGDYVLVAQDQTIASSITTDSSTFPSTMYVVVPGMTPLDSKYVASYYDVYTTDLSAPISKVSVVSGSSQKDNFSDALDTYSAAVATVKRQVPSKFVYGYELGGNGVVELASEDDLPDVYNSTAMLDELYNSRTLIEGVRGTPGKDYFVLRYRYPVGSPQSGTYTDEISGKSFENISYQQYRWVSVFFTLNLVNDKVELDKDNPIVLSGGTPYAEEQRVGGFLNVPTDAYGGGYVSRDAEGHLRLNDFEFLAAGVSAYQLGEDRTEGSGLDITELQDIFDQYINQRIAFPNDTQLYRAAEKGLRSDVITIELNIGSNAEGNLNIYDIDSRFSTSVHLKITGTATENVVINIMNCQRLRISLDPTSNPTIILNNVCLYYDADILDRIAQISGLSLWYTQFEATDPALEIDGMTVVYQGKLEPKGTENFWKYAGGNDNCYAYALRQITFASDGTIIGMGVAVTDNTTANTIPVGESIFASSFTLPQSIGLSYPVSRMTKQIKVTGNFVTAYQSSTSTSFTVKHTTFTMLTQKYLKYTDVKEFINGIISFYTRTSVVSDIVGVDQNSLVDLSSMFAIDGWDSGAYHIFYGGVIE